MTARCISEHHAVAKLRGQADHASAQSGEHQWRQLAGTRRGAQTRDEILHVSQRLAADQSAISERRRVGNADAETETPGRELIDESNRLRVILGLAVVDRLHAGAEGNGRGDMGDALTQCETIAETRAIDAGIAALFDFCSELQGALAPTGHGGETQCGFSEGHAGFLEDGQDGIVDVPLLTKVAMSRSMMSATCTHSGGMAPCLIAIGLARRAVAITVTAAVAITVATALAATTAATTVVLTSRFVGACFA